MEGGKRWRNGEICFVSVFTVLTTLMWQSGADERTKFIEMA